MKNFYMLMIVGFISALAALNAKADGIYVGKSYDYRPHTIEQKSTTSNNDLSICPSGHGNSGRDFNYGHCGQFIPYLPEEKVEYRDEYANEEYLAYQHGNYMIGYSNDVYFVVRDFRLMATGDFDFGAEMGINSDSGELNGRIAVKITYVKFKHIQPVILTTRDVFSVAIKLNF